MFWVIIGALVLVAFVLLVAKSVSGRKKLDGSSCIGLDSAIDGWFDSARQANVDYYVAHSSPEVIAELVSQLASNISYQAHEALVRIGLPAVEQVVSVIDSCKHGSEPACEQGANAIVTLERIGRDAASAIPVLERIAADKQETELRRELARLALKAIKG